MIITIKEKLISLNKLLTMHWYSRMMLKLNWDVMIRANKTPYKVNKGDKYKVIITRYAPRYLDYDNLVGAAKSIILDNLKSFNRKKIGHKYVIIERPGYIYDDSPEHLIAEYRQVITKNREYKVTIEINKEE